MRVTGLGSLPGTDFGAAVRFAFDRTPDLPYLPELPARGPSAQLVGRGLGLLAGLGADLVVGQWRLGSAGLDQRRARALLRDDLDVLEENAEGYAGPFKVSVAGPWTLAAATDLAAGGTVLADAGARRDLAASLAEGVGDLLGDLGRRLPGADLVLQVDEPSLPAVLGGRVPTPGGFFRQRAIGLPEVAAGLAAVTAEPARRGLAVPAVLHCCAPGAPVDTLLGEGRDGAGFAGVSLDLDTLATADLDTLAAGLEAGREFWDGGRRRRHPGPRAAAGGVSRRVVGTRSDPGRPHSCLRPGRLHPRRGRKGLRRARPGGRSGRGRTRRLTRTIPEPVEGSLVGFVRLSHRPELSPCPRRARSPGRRGRR
jgi:hypothetical protein